MNDGRSIEERLCAVERAVTDGQTAEGLPDTARMDARLDELETTVGDVDDRLAELEAAVEALRGFAGGVRAVDESVERQANAAIARVERLEAELRDADATLGGVHDPETHADTSPCPGEKNGSSPATETRESADAWRHGDAPSASPDAPTDATLAEAAADSARDVAPVEEESRDDPDRTLAERLRQLL